MYHTLNLKLRIQWENMRLKVEGEHVSLVLPDIVSVPWFIRKKCQQILDDHY